MPHIASPFLILIGAMWAVTADCPAQTPLKPADPKPDYSQEAFVTEEEFTQVDFQNDGGGTRKSSARIRIQSEAGVKQLSIIELGFQSSVETVDVDFLRVRKPDGSTVVTPSDNVQDLDAEITRQAPFYSDLRQKHIAVRGLGIGDVLEYQATWHTMKPIAGLPGQPRKTTPRRNSNHQFRELGTGRPLVRRALEGTSCAYP